MNRRAIIVALLASLAISMLLWNKLQKSQPARVAAPVVQQPTILKKAVVVSKKTVAARTRLEPALVSSAFEIREIIASAVPELAFNNVASITNRYTSVTILPGDIMTPIRLMSEDQIPNLARAIPPGKRAVSIAVTKVTSVGGFIQQGDYVDVIATFRPRNSETITKIVLQDIQILAVGGSYAFEGGIASATPALAASKVELVTLAVTPGDLEKLMFLDSGTSFRLVLKNPNDKDNKTRTKGATERMILSDIGHPDFVQTVKPVETLSTTTAAPVPVMVVPVDDGKVEIMYGATARRELFKYGGPAAVRYQNLPNIMPSYENQSAPVAPAAESSAATSAAAE
ncbi:MAG: Flp pilus assembly protein CpaB [Erysipelotrichia bacterium]|nr:Flp pilus assembly protein CpaB [Erysipelotrichia bacterium]